MTIVEALKHVNHRDIRIYNYDKWMMWNEHFNVWIVYERKRRSRNTKVVIETESEEEAVKELLK